MAISCFEAKNRALSSFGRAPALQAGGDRFEPDRVHKIMKHSCYMVYVSCYMNTGD